MKSAINRLVNLVKSARELPICQLDMRQPMLVEAIAQLTSAVIAEHGEPDRFVSGEDWWGDYKAALENNGFEFLGNGYFAAAFSHANLPGKAIKVGYKKEDSGAAYTAWCRANQGRAGVPVIHDVARHSGCYTVVLDRLEEIEADVCHEMRAYTIVSEIINCGPSLEYCKSLARNQYELDLVETAADIREFFYGIASFDLHSGNVMLDSKGNLVITDPVSFSVEEISFGEIDFDAIINEIAAHKEQAVSQKNIERGRRKHQHVLNPAFYARKARIRKAQLKSRRRMARKQRRLKEIALNEVNGWDLGKCEAVILPYAVEALKAQHNCLVGHLVMPVGVTVKKPVAQGSLKVRGPMAGLMYIPHTPHWLKRK